MLLLYAHFTALNVDSKALVHAQQPSKCRADVQVTSGQDDGDLSPSKTSPSPLSPLCPLSWQDVMLLCRQFSFNSKLCQPCRIWKPKADVQDARGQGGCGNVLTILPRAVQIWLLSWTQLLLSQDLKRPEQMYRKPGTTEVVVVGMHFPQKLWICKVDPQAVKIQCFCLFCAGSGKPRADVQEARGQDGGGHALQGPSHK